MKHIKTEQNKFGTTGFPQLKLNWFFNWGIILLLSLFIIALFISTKIRYGDTIAFKIPVVREKGCTFRIKIPVHQSKSIRTESKFGLNFFDQKGAHLSTVYGQIVKLNYAQDTATVTIQPDLGLCNDLISIGQVHTVSMISAEKSLWERVRTRIEQKY